MVGLSIESLEMLTYAARSVKFGGARAYLGITYIIAKPQGENLHKSVVLRKYKSSRESRALGKYSEPVGVKGHSRSQKTKM